MVVLVVNITDSPGSTPVQADVYNKTLAPGAEIRIPADLINEKLRALERNGLIAIGSLPSWYTTAKKRKGKVLSENQMKARIITASSSNKKKDKDLIEDSTSKSNKG